MGNTNTVPYDKISQEHKVKMINFLKEKIKNPDKMYSIYVYDSYKMDNCIVESLPFLDEALSQLNYKGEYIVVPHLNNSYNICFPKTVI